MIEKIKTLPDHSEEFEKAKEMLQRVVNDINWHNSVSKELSKFKVDNMIYIVDGILCIIADLSMSRFEIRDMLEEAYSKQYVKSPALGKKLFIKEYEELHEPYDKIKNKCFDLLGKLQGTAILDKF